MDTHNIAEEFDDHDLMMEMQPEMHHEDENVESDNTVVEHDTANIDEGITVGMHNSEPLGGDGAVDNDGDNSVGGDNGVGDVMDIINQSLTEFLAEAQEEADKATEIAAKKREEANAAEAEAEEIKGRMIVLREKAQALADDEKWTTMYERLRVWSREHGHCNPRRNWQAKIDAEEKALGNWSGKQRRQERLGQLDQFKRAALERIGFAFDTNEHKWDKFHSKLKDYVSKHGKLSSKRPQDVKQGTDIYSQLAAYRGQPKQLLGYFPRGKYQQKEPRLKDVSKKKGENSYKNERFTQERVNVLTEAGLDWQLKREQVIELKEKHNLIFPMPEEPERREFENGDVPALMKHHWLSMFEALVEFKRRNGHTYVSSSNSTPELVHWVGRQRKKMQKLDKQTLTASKKKLMNDYQADMLSSIGFVYNQADVDWMDNYERLAAYKRLFGVLAVTNKFCSFESLEQWLDDEKRTHLSLPLLNLDVVASLARLGRENIMIQKEERLRLLTELGAFDVAFGKEEEALRKSHYFFRTMDQVLEYGPTHKSRGEMKDAEIKAKGPFYDIPSTSSEKDPQNEANESPKTPPTTVYHINGHTIDAAKERDFFLQRGAIVSASMDERQNLPKSNHGTRFFDDGRPYTLCRISGCFSRNGGEKNQRLCQRHYTMIEGYTACDAIASKHTSKEAISDDTSVNSNASKTNYSCSYCDSQFDSYNEAAIHEKNCDCWSVQEATGIPAPTNLSSNPPWMKVLISENLKGEAKVLAEDYRYNVWKLAMDYRKKSSAKPSIKNKRASAALGDESPFNRENESYCLPVVRYPSKEEELEHMKLFRRITGPLAATFSGRAKLENEGCLFYGDGRPLQYCRVAGCQMVHSASDKAKFFCDWHFSIIKRPLESDESMPSEEPKRKRREQQAYEQASQATKKARKAGLSPSTPPPNKPMTAKTLQAVFLKENKAKTLQVAQTLKTLRAQTSKPSPIERKPFSVVLPPGLLGIVLESRKYSRGTVVVTVQQSSPAAKKIKAGDSIISIDGEDVSLKSANEVCARFAQKSQSYRTLTVLPALKSNQPASLEAAESNAALSQPTPHSAAAAQLEKSVDSDAVVPSAMAVEASLEPADSEMKQFIDC